MGGVGGQWSKMSRRKSWCTLSSQYIIYGDGVAGRGRRGIGHRDGRGVGVGEAKCL